MSTPTYPAPVRPAAIVQQARTGRSPTMPMNVNARPDVDAFLVQGTVNHAPPPTPGVFLDDPVEPVMPVPAVPVSLTATSVPLTRVAPRRISPVSAVPVNMAQPLASRESSPAQPAQVTGDGAIAQPKPPATLQVVRPAVTQGAGAIAVQPKPFKPVFTQPIPPAWDENAKSARIEMAHMKILTRLLGSVFLRPGSSASEESRIEALTTLCVRSSELGCAVALAAGDGVGRSDYIRSMSTDAAASLVCQSWERGQDVNWEKLILAAVATPEILRVSGEIAKAVYRPVDTEADAADRILISMHSAFWRVYTLGETVNGMTPQLASQVVRDCASYLQGRDKPIVNNDLYISWLQGSIGRMTELVCAEITARFANKPNGPTEEEIKTVLAVSRSGFEGVEDYAQNMFEKPSTNPVSSPHHG